MPTEKHASAVIDDSLYSLSLNTSPIISMDVSPTVAGNLVVVQDTVSATTAAPGGYKLYLSTNNSSDNTIYLNGNSDNNTSDKQITATTGTYASPVALDLSSTNGIWGYAVAGLNNFDASYSTTNPSASAKFAAVPNQNSEQLIHTNSSTASNDETDIYYGVKVNTALASGSYYTDILYSTTTDISSEINGEATMSPIGLATGYAATTATITTSLQTEMTNLGTITISLTSDSNTYACSNPTQTGNNPVSFTCTIPANMPDGVYDASVNISRLGKTYTISSALKIFPSLQSFTNSTCTSLTLNQQYRYIDTRDSKVYYISRLSMNVSGTETACWMTQNLDLTLSTSTTLTPTDSDVSANWTPSVSTQTTQYDGLGSSALWNSDYNTAPHSYRPASDANAGTSGQYGSDTNTYFSPVILTNGITMSSYKTEAECVAAGNTAENCAHWNVGTYYSWYAATAGTGNANVSTVTNVSDSICSKGWHLPSSTSSGEFQALVTAGSVTASTITGAPYYFLRSGRYSGGYGAIIDTGDSGKYWSSTSYSNTRYSYLLSFDSSDVSPSGYYDRYGGVNVRCVANNNSFSLNYDANNGSGAPSAQTAAIAETSKTFTISSTVPTRTNYTFLGWSTSSSATSAEYSAGDTISVSTSDTNNAKTLYAVWRINTVTVTISSNDTGYGTVSTSSVTATIGDAVSTSSNTLTIGSTTITATAASQTAQYTYAFSSWTNGCGSTVTGACTIKANFTRTTRTYKVTFTVNTSGYGSVSRSSLTVAYGSTVSISSATATVAGTATTATAASQTSSYRYLFSSWTNGCGSTVTAACTITANFTRQNVFKLYYNLSGGSGSIATQTYYSTASTYTATVSSTTPTSPITTSNTYDGTTTSRIYAPSESVYNVFQGWSTDPNSMWGTITAGSSITLSSSSTTLYATYTCMSTVYGSTLDNGDGSVWFRAVATLVTHMGYNKFKAAYINSGLQYWGATGYYFSSNSMYAWLSGGVSVGWHALYSWTDGYNGSSYTSSFGWDSNFSYGSSTEVGIGSTYYTRPSSAVTIGLNDSHILDNWIASTAVSEIIIPAK